MSVPANILTLLILPRVPILLGKVHDGAAGWAELMRGIRTYVDDQSSVIHLVPWLVAGALVIAGNVWVARRILRQLAQAQSEPRDHGARKDTD